MSHNTVIDTMSGGDTIADYDLSAGGAAPTTGKAAIGVLYVGATSSTTPTIVTAANGLYVQPGTSTTWAATQSGTWNVGTVTTLTGITNVVHVDDNSGSLTVDGTVAATQSGSWTVTANAGSGTFAVSAASLPLPSGASTAAAQATGNASVASIDGKVTACNTGAVVLAAGSAVVGHVIVDTAPTTAVTGTFWQATQPVSAASLPLPSGAATESTLGTLSGKVTACNTGAVVVSTLPATPAGSNTIGYVHAVPAGDSIEIAGTTYTVKRAFANATASGETTVVTAVSAKKIRVLAYTIGPVSAAVNVYFDNATDGAITSTKSLAANGGLGRGLNHFGHFQTGTNNEALRINLSTTANVGVDVTYIEA